MGQDRPKTPRKAGRLKVFQARFGFYDSVVAASSQAAALRAWGTHQNLFADGGASVATDAEAVAEALAQPEVPLRRALGSTGPFALHPAELPSVPDLPAPAKRRPKAATKPASAPQPPDRSRLDAAERALADIDRARRAEERDFAEQQAELDAAIVAARTRYRDRRRDAKADLEAARDAYRKAGGAG